MSGFKLVSSALERDLSVNCATTTAKAHPYFCNPICLQFPKYTRIKTASKDFELYLDRFSSDPLTVIVLKSFQIPFYNCFARFCGFD